MVKPDEVDDLKAIELAHNISKRIENELDYPGQIKVIVIREKRAVDYAKWFTKGACKCSFLVGPFLLIKANKDYYIKDKST